MTKEIYLLICEDIRKRREACDDERFSLDADYIETSPFQVGDIVKCEIKSPSPDKWIIERVGVKEGEFIYDVSPIIEDEEIRTHEHISECVPGDSLVKIN